MKRETQLTSAPPDHTTPNALDRPSQAPVLLIAVLLVLATVTAYLGVGRAGFVNLDDDAYVEFQPMVNQGFRSASVVWALTGIHSSNWHPLTTFSHMLDCELFGVRAAPMHWVNLAWHTLNTLLVFLVWRLLTGTMWRSALVAALFALHPLHVESVAWISERKDVLHAFFWLLGLGAYCRYVHCPSLARYTLVALALVLALLAKPMAVTFPCTLLLLDLWPLKRWPAKSWFVLLREKLPLFALVFAHSVATYWAQHTSGAADFGLRFSLGERVGNALVAYVRYLGKTAWPTSLSPFYPHPGQWPLWAVTGATALLIVVTFLAWKLLRTRAWFAFGWLWFLGTLVPVIGLIQVGAQSMADRYTYVPLLGVFTMIAWGGAELATRGPRLRTPLIAATLLVIGGCWVLTQRQVPAWQNSLSLYEHTIKAGQDNATIRYLLAVATQAAGRPEAEVVAHYRKALEFEPDYINASTQLAILALNRQQPEEARRLLEENVRLQPKNPGVHNNLGAYYSRLNQPDRAIVHFQAALQISAKYPEAHRELARIYLAQNKFEEARTHLEAFVRVSPWNAEVLCELGTLEGNMRQFDQARQHLERAVWIAPNYPAAVENLRVLNQITSSKR